MKLSKQELADIFDDASDFDGSNEQAFDARKALEAGTLEIEGYERSGWTRFDPNDPKTFPPEGAFVLVCHYDHEQESHNEISVFTSSAWFEGGKFDVYFHFHSWKPENKDVFVWKPIDTTVPWKLFEDELNSRFKATKSEYKREHERCKKYIEETLSPRRGIDEFLLKLSNEHRFAKEDLREIFGVSLKRIREWILLVLRDRNSPLNVKFGRNIAEISTKKFFRIFDEQEANDEA